MDYSFSHSKQQICSKHNSPIVVANIDPKIGLCCVICLQLMPGNIPIEQYNQQQLAGYEKEYQKQLDLDHQQFQSLLNELLKNKKNMINGLDQIMQRIQDQMKLIEDLRIKINSVKSGSTKDITIKIQQVAHKQQLINTIVKDKLGNLLLSFQSKYAEIDQLFTKLKNNQIEKIQQEENSLMNNMIKIQEVCMDKKQQIKKVQYELIKQSTVQQDNFCYAFEFNNNNNNNVLLIGCGMEIIVYEFMYGRIAKEQQRLAGHTNSIYCLYFMKKSNSFVSGSTDYTIIIWIFDQNKKWVVYQILKEHTNLVSCILMNKMEDLLVSGSVDCTLKFWKLMSDSWVFEQSIITKQKVRNLSLNDTEDKLIVCQNNYYSATQKSSIQVLMQNKSKQWNIVQTLDFDRLGWRLCFTIADQFVFTTYNSQPLEIYDYNKNKQQFQKVSQLQIKNIGEDFGGFPCQYITSLSILKFKHGQFLNIIKVNENYNYELIQEIQYGDYDIYGRMSEDGKYLATWEESTKEIQIRKMQYLE